MIKTIILEAERGDACAILALQRMAYQSERLLYSDCVLPPLTETLEDLQASFDDQVFLKAISGRHIIGSVRAFEKNGVCHIGRLIVHPKWQRKGIGTALIRAIEKCFRHAKKMALFTGEKSEGNIRLYKRLGYCETGKIFIAENLVLVVLEKSNSL